MVTSITEAALAALASLSTAVAVLKVAAKVKPPWLCGIDCCPYKTAANDVCDTHGANGKRLALLKNV